jgi:hypothetical protein
MEDAKNRSEQMTEEEHGQEGGEEAIEDLEAPAAQADSAVGAAKCPDNTACSLPTKACSNPTCTTQTYCKATAQGCAKPTCQVTAVWVQ